MKVSRNKLRLKKKKRINFKIRGTSEKPRFSIFKSLTNLTAQIVDDEKGKTLVFFDLKKAKAKNNIEGAKILGKLVAKKCLEKGINQIVFDRSGYKYHGKIKSLAEGSREGGLKF
jgi:large subunit ribosomal protein L18